MLFAGKLAYTAASGSWVVVRNGMDVPFLQRHLCAKVEMDSTHLKGKERPR